MKDDMIMLEELVRYDKELFLFLNNLGNTSWDGFWMFMTNKFTAIPLYFVLLFLTYRKFGLKKTFLVLISVALMILVTDQLSNLFKDGVQRLRPCYDSDLVGLFRLVKNSCGGKFGYFSAHAANSFAVAFFFSLLLKSKIRFIGIFLMVWAVLVTYSRVYIGVHFPLDLVTGALIGIGASWLFAKLTLLAGKKFGLE